jgi:hypothetical protein
VKVFESANAILPVAGGTARFETSRPRGPTPEVRRLVEENSLAQVAVFILPGQGATRLFGAGVVTFGGLALMVGRVSYAVSAWFWIVFLFLSSTVAVATYK